MDRYTWMNRTHVHRTHFYQYLVRCFHLFHCTLELCVYSESEKWSECGRKRVRPLARARTHTHRHFVYVQIITRALVFRLLWHIQHLRYSILSFRSSVLNWLLLVLLLCPLCRVHREQRVNHSKYVQKHFYTHLHTGKKEQTAKEQERVDN